MMRANFAALMRPWTARWGLPGLEYGIRVRFSRRLHRTLGRCRPERGEIVLHAALQDAPTRRLASVLCHEAAHIAAYQLFGSGANPHGEEWATLVHAAGFRPAVRASLRSSADNTPRVSRRTPMRGLVVHRCPVCQTERVAKQVVRGWRCAECVAAGLEGLLVSSVRERTPA